MLDFSLSPESNRKNTKEKTYLRKKLAEYESELSEAMAPEHYVEFPECERPHAVNIQRICLAWGIKDKGQHSPVIYIAYIHGNGDVDRVPLADKKLSVLISAELALEKLYNQAMEIANG